MADGAYERRAGREAELKRIERVLLEAKAKRRNNEDLDSSSSNNIASNDVKNC